MKKPLEFNSLNKHGITPVVVLFFMFFFSGHSNDLANTHQGDLQKEQPATANMQATELVIIGSSFENKIALKASLPIDVVVLEVSYSDELLTKLKNALRNNPNIRNVHLFSGTNEDGIELGNDVFNTTTLDAYADLFTDISEGLGHGDVLNFFVYSCSLSNNANGRSFLSRLADETNFNVLSATNCDSIHDEDFVFDYSSANSVIPTTTIFH